MKKILMVTAMVALSALLMASAPREAKADGGVVVGVGAYLLGDAVVGHHCRIRSWPFNIATKIGNELHGRRGCHPRYYRKHRSYHRHHYRRRHR
jgi:hypothetical protein